MIILKHFIRFIDGTTRIINYLSTITILLLMILMVVGIITRLIGAPLSGVTNLSESLMVIAIYLAVAYAQQMKQHVSVELFLGTLKEKTRTIFNAINWVIPLIICSVFVFTSWDYAIQSWNLRETMDGAPFYPIYPPKIAIAVGVSLLWLQLLADLFREVIQLFSKPEGEVK